jgi:hypothetical protein
MKYNFLIHNLDVQPEVLRHCALDVFWHIQHEVNKESMPLAAFDLGSLNCSAFLIVGHCYYNAASPIRLGVR